MPKAYWIVHLDITDPAAYPAYIAAQGDVFARHGGRFIVRGGAFDALEGAARARHVVIEFPSMEAARACYHSPDYQAALKLRLAASEGEAIIVEGVP